jgi:hypothetical protein
MNGSLERRQTQRLGLGGACLVNYLYLVLAAALLATPAMVALGSSGIRRFPDGDAQLFEPGGLYLLEVLLHERAELSELIAPSLLLGLLFALARLVPERLLLAAVWRRATPAVAPLEAPRALAHLAALGLASWVLRVALLLATVALAMTLRSYAASARDERWPLLVTGSVAALGLLAQGAVSVLRDLAQLDVVGRGASAPRAVRSALVAARRSGARLAGGFAAAAVASTGLLVVAVVTAAGLDVAHGGAWPSLAAVLLHQLAIAGSLGLRAAWLCGARRALAPRALEPLPGVGGGATEGGSSGAEAASDGGAEGASDQRAESASEHRPEGASEHRPEGASEHRPEGASDSGAAGASDGTLESASGRSVLVDLEVTPSGGLPAQVEAQQAPGEAGPGGVPERREPARDRTE